MSSDVTLDIRFTYELDNFKKNLIIKESYPDKNPHECKIKKEYGNKAYQEGKDLDALYLYTQVCRNERNNRMTPRSW